MAHISRARSEYNEPIRCADCGKESGQFVMDTDDHEVICIDCLMEHPSDERAAFDEAESNAVNLVAEASGHGRWLNVKCVNCGAEIEYFDLWDDEDAAYQQAAELLEADKAHDCPTTCVMCGDEVEEGDDLTIDGDPYCRACYDEAKKEDGVG